MIALAHWQKGWRGDITQIFQVCKKVSRRKEQVYFTCVHQPGVDVTSSDSKGQYFSVRYDQTSEAGSLPISLEKCVNTGPCCIAIPAAVLDQLRPCPSQVLHKSLCTYHSVICAVSGVVCAYQFMQQNCNPLFRAPSRDLGPENCRQGAIGLQGATRTRDNSFVA